MSVSQSAGRDLYTLAGRSASAIGVRREGSPRERRDSFRDGGSVGSALIPISTMNKPLTRAEVVPETTWDLADLFATRDAWRAELGAVERSVASVVQHQGRLAASPAVLLACLDARDELLARLDRVEAFAGLREAEDGGNAAHQADQSTAA